MGFCQKIISVFFKKKYFNRKFSHEDVDEDYDVENPLFTRHFTGYAIKEKRPFTNRTGFYNMYVVHSGHDETM